ncbi:DUF4113 domain-containing protein [Aeromonas sp. QDB07]
MYVKVVFCTSHLSPCYTTRWEDLPVAR